MTLPAITTSGQVFSGEIPAGAVDYELPDIFADSSNWEINLMFRGNREATIRVDRIDSTGAAQRNIPDTAFDPADPDETSIHLRGAKYGNLRIFVTNLDAVNPLNMTVDVGFASMWRR